MAKIGYNLKQAVNEKKKESVENIRIPVNRYVKQGREREMGESITVGTARRGERCMTTLERWPSCYISVGCGDRGAPP